MSFFLGHCRWLQLPYSRITFYAGYIRCRWVTYAQTSYDSTTATTCKRDVLKMTKLKGVIGLEIHAQISTQTKLFSGSRNEFGSAVNTQVSFFDAALPGTLPVLNKECVKAGVRTALALNCQIQKMSKFDRKHYFYADLPAGYQITQQRMPLAINGHLSYVVYNPAVFKEPFEKSARIIQLQLEQDSGKSLHDEAGGYSLIDLNRAGTGLMEIVTDADFSSGEEAAAFVKELHGILTAVNSCDGKMSEGSMRVDANISVHAPGEPLGTRTEVKNINSVRNVAKAIEFEIDRQIKLIEGGNHVVNETRTFDVECGETLPMRDKEIKQDYRFMPEPNLPPLWLFDNTDDLKGVNVEQMINIDDIQSCLPELPAQTRERLRQEYNISVENSIILVNEGLTKFFQEVMKYPNTNTRSVLNIIRIHLLYILKEKSESVEDMLISSEQFADLCVMVDNGSLSRDVVNTALELMFESPSKSLCDIASENDLYQVCDIDIVRALCQEVIVENSDHVKKYKPGKKQIFKRLVNEVLKKSNHKASGKIVAEILTDLLENKR